MLSVSHNNFFRFYKVAVNDSVLWFQVGFCCVSHILAYLSWLITENRPLTFLKHTLFLETFKVWCSTNDSFVCAVHAALR